MKKMILLRRYRRLFSCCSYVCRYVLICSVCLFALHYLWCATKSICTDRFLCPRRQMILYSNTKEIQENQQSLCSQRSGKRGPKQHVIGVSAYLSNEDNKKILLKVKKYLLQYIQEAKVQYPEWIVRVYYYSLNITKEEISHIEQIYPNVDFCDSTNLPLLGNVVPWLPGKMQRFLPLVDPLVDIYMSRDLDSPILDRETIVVGIWLNSKKTIQIIRDHPEHNVPILGGLWGIKTNQEHSLIEYISQYLLSPDVVKCHSGAHDQTFLTQYIWPHVVKYPQTTLEYDSFLCERFRNSQPFPIPKKSPTHFIGCRRPICTTDEHPECPEKCRPVNHSDWKWC